MLGVSGVRGIVGDTMTAEVARRFAWCWGAHLATTSDGIPSVCLGRDSRPSGEAYASAAAAGLSAAGCRVVDLGIVATPTVGVMIGATRAAGGVVITASHNPSEWNGLKLLDGFGTAPAPELAAEIIERFQSEESVPSASEGEIVSEGRATDTHVSKVLGEIDPLPIRECGFKVVLDSVNGAGATGGLRVLDCLGCEVTHLGGSPDGDFQHAPEPIASNLGELVEVVRRFAQGERFRLFIGTQDQGGFGEQRWAGLSRCLPGHPAGTGRPVAHRESHQSGLPRGPARRRRGAVPEGGGSAGYSASP